MDKIVNFSYKDLEFFKRIFKFVVCLLVLGIVWLVDHLPNKVINYFYSKMCKDKFSNSSVVLNHLNLIECNKKYRNHSAKSSLNCKNKQLPQK